MNKLKLASGVLLVFLVGALAGSLGTGYYYKKRVETFEVGRFSVDWRIEKIIRGFSNELDLTNEQRTEIEKIIKESQEKQITLTSTIQPEIKQINDDTLASIKKKLTEEQKAKYETLMKRMEEVNRRFPSGGQHQQQRTPDLSRPQQQGGPDQGRQQQGAPEQSPLQAVPDQAPPQGTPGQNPLPVAPDSAMPRGGTPDAVPSQRDYMRIAVELKEHLTLSQEQEEKLKPLLEKFSKDQQNVFEKYKQEKQDSVVIKNALLETEKSFEKDLSNILSKEQMEKYRKEKEIGAIKLSPRDMP